MPGPPTASGEGAVAQLPDCEQAAVQSLFDNDCALFLTFRAACIEQFEHDFRLAAALLAAQQDRAALMRLAHSLKGVLNTLGHTEIGALAHGLQVQVERADWVELQGLWTALRLRLVAAFGLDLSA
ncbi:MAG: Hpt domain-containing protein [Serpentinimonas sp.]|nr:Hpt domain-containing protein [Serpentinimonas sp.]